MRLSFLLHGAFSAALPLLAMLTTLAPAQAQCPTGNVLYVKADATGANTGVSWENAFTNLQSAINSACPGITQIWVAAGVYKPSAVNDRFQSFVMRNNRAIYGGFIGTETTLEARDWRNNLTLLSGDIGQPNVDSDNSYHVIRNYNISLNNSAVLDGFTIAYGNATGSGSRVYGGGMFNFEADPIIANCTFLSNKGANGAGVANQSASPSYINCQFIANTSTGTGGAVYNEVSSSMPSFINCSFIGNISVNGGGIYSWANAKPVLINCTFTGNRASNGGAVLSSFSAVTTLTNCLIWNNMQGSSNTTPAASARVSVGANNLFSHCLVANSGGSGGSWTAVLGTDNGGNIDTDPMLEAEGAPATAPNAVGGYALQSCSPAIDAGTSSGAPTTDIEGNGRPANAGVDIGASEFQAAVTARVTCYADADNDSYGNPANPKFFCVSCGDGYVSNALDCYDNDANTYPGAEEVCDGVDNDCNGTTDDIDEVGLGVSIWRTAAVGAAGGSATFPPCNPAPEDVFSISSTGVSSPAADQQFMVYQSLCGNSVITARVLTVNGGGWAGVMIRETAAAGAKRAVLKTQLNSLIRREIRTVNNGPVSNLQFNRPQHIWLRLERNGATLTGYTSMNGAQWTAAFSVTISMAPCVYVGLFSESINVNAATVATFDNVSASGGMPLPLAGIETAGEAAAWQPASNLTAFPNPTSGEVSLRLPQLWQVDPRLRGSRLRVLNALGQPIAADVAIPAGEETAVLSLAHLPNGIYWIQALPDGQPPLSVRIVLAK